MTDSVVGDDEIERTWDLLGEPQRFVGVRGRLAEFAKLGERSGQEGAGCHGWRGTEPEPFVEGMTFERCGVPLEQLGCPTVLAGEAQSQSEVLAHHHTQ